MPVFLVTLVWFELEKEKKGKWQELAFRLLISGEEKNSYESNINYESHTKKF